MPALPQYTPVSVARAQLTTTGKSAPVTLYTGILVQIIQQSPAETDDNKSQTPLNVYFMYTYKPAWRNDPLPDIQTGDRLTDNSGLEYVVQGVKNVYGSYLEIQASIPRGT